MDKTFDHIDRQLSLSEDSHRVQSLKSLRNSLAPVSRLPHILLTDIFILIHRSERINESSLRSPPCLHISHVCRAWRDAALQCPLLWTNILFCPPQWTAVMLERSRNAPLRVEVPIQHLNLADHTFVTSVRLALSHIRHIRYLYIILFDRFRDLGDLLSPFLTGTPDILEELILSSFSVFPNYTYPSMKNAPCLRSLELYSCHINWRLLSSVGNLTSLVLKDIPMASRPSIENIISLLQTMTKLEKLSLTHAISELPPNIRTLPPNDVAPLKLQNLIYISLTGFVLDCANLMRHLNLPRCRRVTLKAVTRWHAPEVTLAVPPLANVISSCFGQLDRQESPYLASINRSYDNVMELTAHPTLDSEELTLYLSLTWHLSPSRQRDIVEISPGFGHLLSSLPLSRVVDFSASLFCRDDHAEGVEWLEILPRLSRTEKAVLTGGYTYGFVNAFHEAHAMDVSSFGGTDTIILPTLTSLTIKHAHFSFPLGHAQLFSTLKRALARRLESEWAVPTLALISCHITQQQLAVLNTLALGPVDCSGEPQTWGVGESDSGPSDEDSLPNDDDDDD
jgi:F-box-like